MAQYRWKPDLRENRKQAVHFLSKYGKMTAGLRKCALLDVFDPGAVHPDGNIVLFLACDCAGVTANASVLVYDKTVAHAILSIAPVVIADILI